MRRQVDGLLVSGNGRTVVALLKVSQRHVVKRVGPVWRAAHGVAKSQDGAVVFGPLQERNTQGVVGVCVAGVETDGALQQIGGGAVLLAEDLDAALAEVLAGFQENGIARQQLGGFEILGASEEIGGARSVLLAAEVADEQILPLVLERDF